MNETINQSYNEQDKQTINQSINIVFFCTSTDCWHRDNGDSKIGYPSNKCDQSGLSDSIPSCHHYIQVRQLSGD